MSDQEISADQNTEQDSYRTYLQRAYDIMTEAQDIVVMERATLLQAMGMTSMEMAKDGVTAEQAEDLSEHMDYLMNMLGQYSIALTVLRTIGGAALQGLANTGIRVPEAAPILGPDGEILAKPRKPRKTKP